MANTGGMGGYGAEATAVGMAGAYSPGYGSGSAYGFGTATAGHGGASGIASGGCCGAPPGHFLPPPYPHPGVNPNDFELFRPPIFLLF